MEKVICPICRKGRLFDANPLKVSIKEVNSKTPGSIKIKCNKCGKEIELEILNKEKIHI